MYCVLCDIVIFIALIILSIVGQRGRTPLQAAEEWLPRDSGPSKENRSRIISHIKGLDENV